MCILCCVKTILNYSLFASMASNFVMLYSNLIPYLTILNRILPCRLEGTPAYMPPEQLRHLRALNGSEGDGEGGGEYEGRGVGGEEEAVSGTAGDAWALGCVASFCLHGRPLFIGAADEVSRPKGTLFISFDFDMEFK